MNKEEFHKLLRNYLDGKSTEDEVRRIDHWYERMADHSVSLSESERMQIKHRVLDTIREELPSTKTRNVATRKSGTRYWRAAAAVLALVVAGYSLVTLQQNDVDGGVKERGATGDQYVYKNVTDTEQKIAMPDGSTVLLQPQSIVTYARNFDAGKREVYLEGDAFFDVVKNPEKPFYVYGGNVTTKVLGTSFFVSAPQNASVVKVKVRSGRVSVYEQAMSNESRPLGTTPVANGVVLQPNEMVTYFVSDSHWVTGLVEDPLQVTAPPEKSDYKFDSASLLEIVQKLERDYGIEFIIEQENVYNCNFTGDISVMPLYDKLTLICKSIGVNYEIRGTTILINGGGCE